jgi:hypothetical protein
MNLAIARGTPLTRPRIASLNTVAAVFLACCAVLAIFFSDVTGALVT